MKREIIQLAKIISIICCVSFSSCSTNKEQNEIPNVFEKFILETEIPINNKKVVPYYGNNRLPVPDFITSNEALIDIEYLEYLIKTSYSGFEYWKHQGVDFDNYFEKLKHFALENDTISIENFEKEWVRILAQIKDGHIGFIGKEEHNAYKHKSVYFSEIIVKKTSEGKLQVIDSRFDGVKIGDVFTQKTPEKYLFKTLSPTHENHYLIGEMSFECITSNQLSFNNKVLQVPFFENRLNYAKFNQTEGYYLERKNNIPVLRVSSFANQLNSVLQKFTETGKELVNEERVIINVMNNGGGSSMYPQKFIENLNGAINWETYWAILESPPILEYSTPSKISSQNELLPEINYLNLNNGNKLSTKNTTIKKWKFDSTPNKRIKQGYKGTLIVLANRNVLSAGEAMVGVSNSVKKRILIGENTGGSVQFPSAYGYYLPNSKFIVNLPRHLIIIPGINECIGYKPDYWLNTTQPLDEILNWINNPTTYQFSYKKNFNQLLEELESNLDFPEDLNIILPDNIPKNYIHYSGKWFGVTDGTLDFELVIENIHENLEVDAVYAWGTAPQWGINSPGWQRLKGKFDDHHLILFSENGDLKITCKSIPGDKLDFTYKRGNIYSRAELIRSEN